MITLVVDPQRAKRLGKGVSLVDETTAEVRACFFLTAIVSPVVELHRSVRENAPIFFETAMKYVDAQHWYCELGSAVAGTPTPAPPAVPRSEKARSLQKTV